MLTILVPRLCDHLRLSLFPSNTGHAGVFMPQKSASTTHPGHVFTPESWLVNTYRFSASKEPQRVKHLVSGSTSHSRNELGQQLRWREGPAAGSGMRCGHRLLREQCLLRARPLCALRAPVPPAGQVPGRTRSCGSAAPAPPGVRTGRVPGSAPSSGLRGPVTKGYGRECALPDRLQPEPQAFKR